MARIDLEFPLPKWKIKAVKKQLPRKVAGNLVFKLDKRDKGDPTAFVLIEGNKATTVRAVIDALDIVGAKRF